MHHDSPQAPRLDAAASFVKSRSPLAPRVALVLGSGLGDYADTLAARTVIPFADVPGMPQSHVVGHAGNLVLGHVGEGGLPVIAMQGRVHLYEGHPVADVVFGVRLMIRLGASIVLVTNAAGGLADGMQPGDLMRIDDHLNLTARSPLAGAQFVDLVDAYSPRLRALARSVDPTLAEGVYAAMPGPHYETPAEIRMLRTLGADLVGMSTVHETIAARAEGAEVLGVSLVTNLAAGMTGEALDHHEVLAAGRDSATGLGALLADVLSAL